MEEKSKINTKVWYGCGTCGKKMDTISLGSGGELFDFGGGKRQALWCENKECDKFGYLTLVGIKKEE